MIRHVPLPKKPAELGSLLGSAHCSEIDNSLLAVELQLL